jgi:hypothetical protein
MKKKIFVISAVAIFLIFIVIYASAVEVNNQNEEYRSNHPPHGQMPPDNRRQDHPPHNNLTEITGILEYNENIFIIDGLELLFGPDEIVSKKASPFDYDGDEIIETIYKEITGLTGTTVTIRGHLNEESQLMVLEINGFPIGRPPHPPHHQEHEKAPIEGQGPGPR